MKNLILGFFIVSIFIQACDDGVFQIGNKNVPTCENCNFTCLDASETDVITNDCIENWECTFRVTSQSSIDLEETEGLTSGDKNVFQMINSTPGDLMAIDDELTNILVFELDETQNSFSVENDKLVNMNVHFRRVCYCVENQFQAVTAGCLQGEKQSDGTWFVQGQLTIPYSFGDVEVKFDSQFMN